MGEPLSLIIGALVILGILFIPVALRARRAVGQIGMIHFELSNNGGSSMRDQLELRLALINEDIRRLSDRVTALERGNAA